jgi:hypothetical protein
MAPEARWRRKLDGAGRLMAPEMADGQPDELAVNV